MSVEHCIYARGACHKVWHVIDAYMGQKNDIVGPILPRFIDAALQQRVECVGIESVKPSAKAASEESGRGQGGDMRGCEPDKSHFAVAIAAYVIAGIDGAVLADTGEIAAQNLGGQLANTML